MFVSYFGKEVDNNRQVELLCAMRSIFNLEEPITEFLGSHPVGLSSKCLDYLLNEDYLVCEKSDGIRIMMFIYNRHIYFYDRKNKFYQTDCIFRADYDFMFDGEMYMEGEEYIYSMFDCLIYDSKPRTEMDLTRRLGYCFQFKKTMDKGLVACKQNTEHKLFKIIAKDMFKSYSYNHVLDSIPNLKHDNDGLIFTPIYEPYLFYTRSKILKWKPPHLITVDFLIKKTCDQDVFILHCETSGRQIESFDRKAHGSASIPFDYYFLDDNVDPSNLDGAIGEFNYDFEKETINVDDLTIKKGGWVFHRVRNDKDKPNNLKIVLDTLGYLGDIINSEDLKKSQNIIMENYKKREVATFK